MYRSSSAVGSAIVEDLPAPAFASTSRVNSAGTPKNGLRLSSDVMMNGVRPPRPDERHEVFEQAAETLR